MLGTGCGSTVRNADVAGGASDGLTTGEDRSVGGLAPPVDPSGRPTDSSVPRSPGSPFTAPEQADGRSSTVRRAGASAHPGVSATKVFIGLKRDRSADPAVSLGAAIPRPPTEQVQTALVNHFNAQGGFAGRKISPVYHDYNTTEKPYSQTQQEACAHFTEDDPVFAAFNAGTYGLQTEDATYQECMAKRGVTTIGSAGTRGDEASYNRLPSMVDVGGLNYTRIRWSLT